MALNGPKINELLKACINLGACIVTGVSKVETQYLKF